MIPVLETERLILRAPVFGDFDGYAHTLTSQRAKFIGGAVTRNRAWRDFCSDAGGWLLRGFGYWTVEDRATGRFAGVVGLDYPISYPEPEIGWVMHVDFEGRGLAFDAAIAARTWAYQALGWSTLVSYIDPRNARSIALAERLGARREPHATLPEGDTPDECLAYRHPGPEDCR